MNIQIANLASADLKSELQSNELEQIRGGSIVQLAIAGTGSGVFQNVGGNFDVVAIPGQLPQIWRINPDGTRTLMF